MSKEPITQVYEALDIDAIRNECETEVETEGIVRCRLNSTDNSIQAFYNSIQYFAQYGPTFRRVAKFFMSKNGNSAFTEVRGYLADLAV